ncbi:arabinofuranosyltransferase AftA domain protein [Mycobacterium xenopi 4042]|uniref:Arabinofuranosyltransferase AftA domain protein n=1 Tax=Mycobacterium xenopi 4042 TaxID=1299334 RepID=X8DJW5_MYCXE|nr:arabinofuranosyltransferase AftA domain protein [Mycobacterium xenopi 4042]
MFLMRRGADDTYTLRLAEDVYPTSPTCAATPSTSSRPVRRPRFTVTNIARSCWPSARSPATDGNRNDTGRTTTI